VTYWKLLLTQRGGEVGEGKVGDLSQAGSEGEAEGARGLFMSPDRVLIRRINAIWKAIQIVFAV